LEEAEKEADVILWDGGNNDFSFYTADLDIAIADPHRLGHETSYYPGEVVARRADVVIINKAGTAPEGNVAKLEQNVRAINPEAKILIANSPVTVEKPELIKGKRVLVIEDGPTLTHGEMSYGAGHVAAEKHGAKEVIDPRPYATGSLKTTFDKYSHLSDILPAMGYGKQQMEELEETINAVDCDSVVVGTPIDLGRLLKINKPSTRVIYELEVISKPGLDSIIEEFIQKQGLK